MLDALGQTAAQLAQRQAAQHQRVGDHRHRLVEGADQVLPLRHVHADLAADRRVDHREQGRRALHERDAAQVGRGREADRVAEHAAAERHDRRAALELVVEQSVVDAAHGLERLALLARRERHGQGREARRLERRARRARVAGLEHGIEEQRRRARRRDRADQLAQAFERPGRDHRVVAVVGQDDRHGRHAHELTQAG